MNIEDVKRMSDSERRIMVLPRELFSNFSINEAMDIIKGDPHYAYYYAKDVVLGRWKEAEDIILEAKNPHYAFIYARDVIKGRWEEAEDLIGSSPWMWHYYNGGDFKI